MSEALTFYPYHPSPEKTHRIETTPMPRLSQNVPFKVKSIYEQFQENLERSLEAYEEKRFDVMGVAVKVGPDIHNKPSIELSDRKGGKTYALVIFPNDEHYSEVSVGDTVTIRANYLVLSNWFGVVMKYSELVNVEKAYA